MWAVPKETLNRLNKKATSNEEWLKLKTDTCATKLKARKAQTKVWTNPDNEWNKLLIFYGYCLSL